MFSVGPSSDVSRDLERHESVTVSGQGASGARPGLGSVYYRHPEVRVGIQSLLLTAFEKKIQIY